MKDLDNWIEMVHAENRKLREAEQRVEVGCSRRSSWSWVASGAAVAVAAVLCLMVVDRQRPMPHEVLAVKTPITVDQTQTEQIVPAHSAKVPIKEKRNAASLADSTADMPAPALPHPDATQVEEEYAYSMSESGIKVYCENQCNADAVLALMENLVKQSAITI